MRRLRSARAAAAGLALGANPILLFSLSKTDRKCCMPTPPKIMPSATPPLLSSAPYPTSFMDRASPRAAQLGRGMKVTVLPGAVAPEGAGDEG